MSQGWSDTVAVHRGQTRDRVLQAFRRSAHKHGITAITMAGLAEEAGIGRATLYKHFPDLPSVALAWAADELDRFATDVEQATRDVAPSQAVGALLLAACDYLASDDHELSAHVMQATLSADGVAALTAHTARLVEVFAQALRPIATRKYSAEMLAETLLGALEALRPRLAAGTLRPTDAAKLLAGLLPSGVRQTAS